MCPVTKEKKRHDAYLKKLNKLIKEVKKNPKKGMSVLIEAGIYTKKGDLTKQYK
jgi:hypothetical protein